MKSDATKYSGQANFDKHLKAARTKISGKREKGTCGANFKEIFKRFEAMRDLPKSGRILAKKYRLIMDVPV